MQFRFRTYDHSDVMAMTLSVLDEYKRLYSTEVGDIAHVEVADFAPPLGWFGVGYEGDRPVAMGGWRLVKPGGAVPGSRPAEIKRMFVQPTDRGRGLSRLMLAEIERTAIEAGVDYLILETGPRQPEAISLYRSSGYADGPRYGAYVDEPEAVHLGKALGVERH